MSYELSAMTWELALQHPTIQNPEADHYKLIIRSMGHPVFLDAVSSI
jgi:hypothetical protein